VVEFNILPHFKLTHNFHNPFFKYFFWIFHLFAIVCTRVGRFSLFQRKNWRVRSAIWTHPVSEEIKEPVLTRNHGSFLLKKTQRTGQRTYPESQVLCRFLHKTYLLVVL
jgi:hypothetical protein